MRHSIGPNYLTVFKLLHLLITIGVILKPGTSLQINQQPIRMRMKRLGFAITNGLFDNSNALVLKFEFKDVWCYSNWIQWHWYGCADNSG